MGNLQSFFKELKKMTVDNLIAKCKPYVEEYLSETESSRLDKAYNESRFDEVKQILEETRKCIKTKTKVLEYQKAEKAVMDEFSAAKKVFDSFDSSDNNEGSQDENMETGNGIIALTIIEGSQGKSIEIGNEMIALIFIIVAIVVIVVIASIGAFNRKLNNKTVDEILSLRTQKGKTSSKAYNYTEKDKDLMELIHELSSIYDNTDEYLKS